MTYIREVKRKNKDGTTVKYYEEVESYRINGKVRQRHIRSLGRDGKTPSSIPIEPVHFGYITTRLMQGDMTPDELLDMLEGMGHRVLREDLEAVGIRYGFKKNSLTLSLYYAAKSGKRAGAESAAKSSGRRKRTVEE